MERDLIFSDGRKLVVEEKVSGGGYEPDAFGRGHRYVWYRIRIWRETAGQRELLWEEYEKSFLIDASDREKLS